MFLCTYLLKMQFVITKKSRRMYRSVKSVLFDKNFPTISLESLVVKKNDNAIARTTSPTFFLYFVSR